MITRNDLKELLSRPPQPSDPVLSLYLNVDQGRSVNLNRGFEAAFKSLVQGAERGLDQNGARRGFQEAVRGASAFLEDYVPTAKTLVLFCNGAGDFRWHRAMDVGLENCLRWQVRPFVRPLVEARDEYQRHGVILTDRAKARLFTVFLGRVEEKVSAFAEADVHRFDGPGMDQLRSQMNLQRKADGHARQHLKHVAELMERIAGMERFDRLYLSGTAETTAELRGLLPERLKKMYVGALTLPVDAPPSAIREETLRLQREEERAREKELVESLVTAAAKQQSAVTGWKHTVEAAGAGRIRQLVYSEGAEMRGMECPACGMLSAGEAAACPHCGGEVLVLEDLANAMVARVVLEGGEVEELREEAAAEFRQTGGIGAFLRF